MKNKISFFNRYSHQIEEELVYGGKAIEWLYSSYLGLKLRHLIRMPFISSIYGSFQNTRISSKKVAPFLEKFKINIDDYEKGSLGGKFESSFYSFNEFFIRKFKKAKRDFPSDQSSLGAPAEARYFGIENIELNNQFPIKEIEMNLEDLLAKQEWVKEFVGGSLLIARLCPVDYHRYHYPDDGKIIDTYFVNGVLDSVNPLALELDPKVLFKNERKVSILETKEFGKLAFIEVGATCVGRIIQSHQENEFLRGEEKGFFLFGGSTVVLIGQKDKWNMSSDIIKNTQIGQETYIHLGDQIGQSV